MTTTNWLSRILEYATRSCCGEASKGRWWSEETKVPDGRVAMFTRTWNTISTWRSSPTPRPTPACAFTSTLLLLPLSNLMVWELVALSRDTLCLQWVIVHKLVYFASFMSVMSHANLADHSASLHYLSTHTFKFNI
ncbi:hypothetical protein EGR_09104 [Echinococcus granulosus]|uniref:Uncharacterized protein n=1 Tax=Echinococcus granulosus TaxID=6210 RepID=W6URL6_ECHGR|nr:hypothetical protein EGR_09104 [Echinococcus granulosus]EUB56024.1 hypothetical protein EGR_09104 [Echinococcus granulosus]